MCTYIMVNSPNDTSSPTAKVLSWKQRDVHTYVYLPWMSLEEDEVSPVKSNMTINNIYIHTYIIGMYMSYMMYISGVYMGFDVSGRGGMVHMEPLSVMSHSIKQ